MTQRRRDNSSFRAPDDPSASWLDRYPYDDIQVLVHVMNQIGDLELLIRKDLHVPIARSGSRKAIARDGTVLEDHPQGLLVEGWHYGEVRADRWDTYDAEQLEHDALLADLFGLHLVAARARSWHAHGPVAIRTGTAGSAPGRTDEP